MFVSISWESYAIRSVEYHAGPIDPPFGSHTHARTRAFVPPPPPTRQQSRSVFARWRANNYIITNTGWRRRQRPLRRRCLMSNKMMRFCQTCTRDTTKQQESTDTKKQNVRVTRRCLIAICCRGAAAHDIHMVCMCVYMRARPVAIHLLICVVHDTHTHTDMHGSEMWPTDNACEHADAYRRGQSQTTQKQNAHVRESRHRDGCTLHVVSVCIHACVLAAPENVSPSNMSPATNKMAKQTAYLHNIAVAASDFACAKLSY